MSSATAPGPRSDATAKVTGRALYTGDLRLPGMLHAVVVRSTRPHARIRFIETSAALASPHVVDVITAADLTGLDAWFGNIVIDRPILAVDVTRFEGEPVAIVVADSPIHARTAAAAVHVGYEDLPVVSSVEMALSGQIPLHTEPSRPGGISGIQVDHDINHNICHRHVRVRGDVDGVPPEAIIIDRTYRFPAVYQYALEPHTALARFTRGDLEVWSSAQHPYAVRRELARIFGLDIGAVRVAVPYIGGGFGSKSWTKIEPLAAVASWKVGAPVRLALDLREAMQTSRRHDASVTIRSAFLPNGRLMARRVRAAFNTGAYTDNGPQVITSSLDSAIGPYHVDAYDLEAVAVFTNSVPSGSMRAIGAPQVNWGAESQMDEAARQLGIDPIALRRLNLAKRDEVVFDNLTPADAVLEDSLDQLASHLDPGASPAKEDDTFLHGSGVALAMTGAGASPVCVAWVRLHADGSLTLHIGSTEIGQGSHTALRMIAARASGVDDSRIRLVTSDSLSAPYDQSTGASRTTTVAGNAVVAAVDDLLAQLRTIAADKAHVGEDAIEIAGTHALWPGGQATFADLVVHHFGSAAGELLGRGYSGRRVPNSLGSTVPLFWEIAMGAAQVRVCRETGEIAVERYVAVSDVGEPIHGPSIRGQEAGAVVMGLGHTLMEQLDIQDGLLQNGSLEHYRVPHMGHAPRQLITDHVANGDGPGPFGARGVGEGAVVPVAGAVANALFDATGIRFEELPLTPEMVWRRFRQEAESPDSEGA